MRITLIFSFNSLTLVPNSQPFKLGIRKSEITSWYLFGLFSRCSKATTGFVKVMTLYPFFCNTNLKGSQMLGSSSTITIDLDDDKEEQLVN